MLFEGINRIYRDYGVFDYPRSGGSRHNGMDIDGVNSFVIRMPSFNGKTISGTVTRSRIVRGKTKFRWPQAYFRPTQFPQSGSGRSVTQEAYAA